MSGGPKLPISCPFDTGGLPETPCTSLHKELLNLISYWNLAGEEPEQQQILLRAAQILVQMGQLPAAKALIDKHALPYVFKKIGCFEEGPSGPSNELLCWAHRVWLQLVDILVHSREPGKAAKALSQARQISLVMPFERKGYERQKKNDVQYKQMMSSELAMEARILEMQRKFPEAHKKTKEACALTYDLRNRECCPCKTCAGFLNVNVETKMVISRIVQQVMLTVSHKSGVAGKLHDLCPLCPELMETAFVLLKELEDNCSSVPVPGPDALFATAPSPADISALKIEMHRCMGKLWYVIAHKSPKNEATAAYERAAISLSKVLEEASETGNRMCSAEANYLVAVCILGVKNDYTDVARFLKEARKEAVQTNQPAVEKNARIAVNQVDALQKNNSAALEVIGNNPLKEPEKVSELTRGVMKTVPGPHKATEIAEKLDAHFHTQEGEFQKQQELLMEQQRQNQKQHELLMEQQRQIQKQQGLNRHQYDHICTQDSDIKKQHVLIQKQRLQLKNQREENQKLLEKMKACELVIEELEEKLQQASDHHENSTQCMICFDQSREIVLVPCGHYATCSGCTNSILISRVCPICKQPIERTLRLYNA